MIRINILYVKRLPLLFLLFLFPISGLTQSYQFTRYGLDEGMSDKFTYTINQDNQGFLWIGTGDGLCRFDGITFENQFRGDTVPASIAHASLLDSKGRLWFGHENGLISVFENGVFKRLEPSADHRSKITAIREDASGNILILAQQSGLIVIDSDLNIIRERDPDDQEDPFADMFLYDFLITPGWSGTRTVSACSGMIRNWSATFTPGSCPDFSIWGSRS